MGWLARLLKWVFIALLVLSAVSLLFPATQTLQRSLLVEHSPDRVWELLEDPPAWNRWSPWYERDPEMKITYTGAPRGSGARWTWSSDSEGSGTISIINASVPRQLDYVVQFDIPVAIGETQGQFILEPVNSGTNVTWQFKLEAGFNPLARWLGLFMDRMLGDDFKRGLNNIATTLEKQPKQ